MLKNIEIVDYKCFKDFKLDGLSNINIISGDNNVGKTALLEALFLERSIKSTFAFKPSNILYTIANNRDFNDNFFNYLKNTMISIKTKDKNFEIKYKSVYEFEKEEREKAEKFKQYYENFLVSKIKENISLEQIDNLKNDYIYFNYINSSKPTNQQLVKLYSHIQTKGIQHKFLTYLKILDNNIAWLEPQLLDDELLLRVNLKNPEISLVSSELGEGTNRYIEILATLLSNSNGSVFIDEIENGIHHSKLKEICKAIIEIVQKENIQLFITTHDEETIEAFAQASEELNYKDISSVQLYKNEENQIESILRNSNNFIYGINRGADVR